MIANGPETGNKPVDAGEQTTVEIMQIDAFADRPFAGNPAAVCVLPGPRDDAWMQHVATEMNLSETAFLRLRSDGDYDLRWFTPSVEVDLCGHATLASAYALWEQNVISRSEPARFHTRSGVLTARWHDSGIEMDFPAQAPSSAVAPPGLVEALGVDPVYVGKNATDVLVEVGSESTVRMLAPDVRRLAEIPVRGVIVTAAADGEDFDFVSRFFAPFSGIDEDPVTGSAHCCLGPFWQRRLGRNSFRAFQASSRGGVVQVRVEGDRVFLTGQAVTVFRGELGSTTHRTHNTPA